MAAAILSGGRTSRFYRSIFEKQQLTQGDPRAGAPEGRYDDTFTIYARPKAPHTSAEVETAIYAELDRLKNEPVTEWELERVRNQIRASKWGQLRSNYSLAFTLSGAYVERGDWRTVMTDFDRLLAITPEDIQRVANKYFVQTNRTVATIVKPEQAN